MGSLVWIAEWANHHPWLREHAIGLGALVVSIVALFIGSLLLWKVRREYTLRSRLELANEIADLLIELTAIVKQWAEVDGSGNDSYDKFKGRLSEISPRVLTVSWRASLLMEPRITKALNEALSAVREIHLSPWIEAEHLLGAFGSSPDAPPTRGDLLHAQAEGALAARRKTKVEAPKDFERRCLALMDDLRVMLHGRHLGNRLNRSYGGFRLIDTSFWEKATTRQPEPPPVDRAS